MAKPIKVIPMKKESTRRSFIKKTLWGSAALTAGIQKPFGTELHSEPAKNEAPLKLGLMTYLLGSEWDIDMIIKNCSETGFVHAQLRTTHSHGVEVSLSKSERTEVKKKFEDSPLESISLASAFQYWYPDQSRLRKSIEDTKAYLQLAADVGATSIRVFPNASAVNVTGDKMFKQIGDALTEVGEFGYNLGVEIRLEMHGKGTQSASANKKILNYSSSNNVFIIWNCMASDTEGEGLQANFNLIKNQIRGVHLHELYTDYPYRELFNLLIESGYNGYCNLEVAKQSSEPIRFMHYYRALFLALQNQV